MDIGILERREKNNYHSKRSQNLMIGRYDDAPKFDNWPL